MSWDADTEEGLMRKVDKTVYDVRWQPLYGWHDDHVNTDGTPNYRPAIQQVRSEFLALLCAIHDQGLVHGRCLQLGLGPGCAHEVWQCLFDDVISIEIDATKVAHHKGGKIVHGNTRSIDVWGKVAPEAPFDFLFIDAGHLYADVKFDYENYKDLVRKGGIIAFHDALPRPIGVEVHLFLDELRNAGHDIVTVGDEVGTAWMVKT